MFVSCHLRTLPTRFVLLPAKPCQVCCSRVFPAMPPPAHGLLPAAKCSWHRNEVTALCSSFSTHHFPQSCPKTAKNHLVLSCAHTESVPLIALVYSRGTFVSQLELAESEGRERERERKWWWRAANPNTESSLASLSLLYHKKKNIVREQLPADTVQNTIRY